MLFLRGLYNQEALIGGIHSCQTGNLLTGAHLAPGGEIRSGISMDQVVAEQLSSQTKVPSLVLGCEQSIAAVHKNYSMIYSSHISWSSPTTPTPLEVYPALAFDRLFRDEVGKADQSVLDAVLEETNGLRNKISQSDQRRLDEYLSSVREVEQRIDRAGKDRPTAGLAAHAPKPDMPRPADGIPQDIDQHMRLMCDILVLAFRTDTTRVCTLKLNNDHSSLRFPHLKVDYMIHHLLSHNDGADWLKVNQFFTQQLAYIAGKLDARAGRRTNLARQLDDPDAFQHDDRQPRQRSVAGGDGRPWRRANQDGPRARLHGQAQSQDVQPVSVAHGQDGRAARSLRRFEGEIGRDLNRPTGHKPEA